MQSRQSFCQYQLETLLIAVPAFPIAYVCSKQVAGTLGTLFGKTAENVIVTPEHFVLVTVAGCILLIMAVLLSGIPAMRFEAETDLIPDGIKETRYEPQNEFRNTGGFTYRPKMEKDAAAFLPASLLLRRWCCRGWRLQMHKRSSPEELRGVTGASFTVNANNGYTLQPVTDEMIQEIAAIDGVEAYNTSQWTIVNLYHQDTLMKGTDEREGVADLFYGSGCFDSEYSPLFLSGALRLTEGRHVTDGNGGIILYEGLLR